MDRIGPDVLVLILRHHPLGVVARVCRLVCKDWCAVISTGRAPLFWQFPSYAIFAYQIMPLPPDYRRLLANGTWTLSLALDAKRLWLMPQSEVTWEFLVVENRISTSFIQRYDRAHFERVQNCFNGRVLISLREGLMTLEQALIVPYTLESLSADALSALREKFFTIYQLESNPSLVNAFGETPVLLQMLREGFITPEFIIENRFCFHCWVSCFTAKCAVDAIRGGYFPFTGNYISSDMAFMVLSSENELLYAIRDGVITWDDVFSHMTQSHIDALLKMPDATKAFRLGLMSLSELINVASVEIQKMGKK